MRGSSALMIRLLPVFAVAACGGAAPRVEQTKPAVAQYETKEPPIIRVPPGVFGEVFPTYVYKDLNPASGTGGRVNLAEVVGKKPLIFLYWIPGNTRAEKMFEEIGSAVAEAGPRGVLFCGVVRPRPDIPLGQIADRILALKLTVPILNDEEFRLGQQLSVRAVPAVAALDAEGRLRFANAGSLKQALEYNMDVEAAIRRVARKGTLATYGSLPRYYPVNELIGKKCPDFEAPLLGEGATRRWSSLFDPTRLNIIVFWSVDCSHCKKSLPQINDWIRRHPDGINLISAANVQDAATRTKTEEYCRLNQFVFPTFVDQELRIGDLYQVTSTPTILIIRPDGVIDSVLLGEGDFAATFEAKKKQLLSGSSSKS